VHLEEPVIDMLWQRVLADLERRPFAVLRRNDARRLLEGVDELEPARAAMEMPRQYARAS
jgi:hypothetical protein